MNLTNDDRNAEAEARHIDEIISNIEKIKKGYMQMEKDYKKLNDVFTKSATSERTIINKIVDHTDEDHMKEKLCKWYDSLTDKQKSTNQAVKNINDVLITSGKKYINLTTDIVSINKQREQLNRDLENAQQKLKKLESKERTGANLVKIKEVKVELQRLQNGLYEINTAIIEDGDMMISSSQDFFCLPLKSLIKSHLVLFENLNQECSNLSDMFSSDIDLMKQGATPEEHLQNQIRDIASELSIVRQHTTN